MREGNDRGMQRWEALAVGKSSRAEVAIRYAPRRTPSGNEAQLRFGDIFKTIGAGKAPKTCKTSEWAVVNRLRGGSIRKKVIGHRLRPIPAGIGPGKHFRDARGAFALIHKPAGQPGSGVFFDPFFQQRPNFLAEIGGMRKT